MDINELWQRLEREGEAEVRRKLHQQLYGLPSSLKYQAVEGWLAYNEWKRASEQSEEAEADQEAAELDDRLPLFRRKVFDTELVSFTEQAGKEGNPLGLLMIDLDRFKQVNDQHGHQVGDEVLLSVSSVVSKRVRGKGRGYRYGGEEIAVLLPNFSVEECAVVAELIRKEVEQLNPTPHKILVTVSVGVAVFPRQAENERELVRLSDQALYEAKDLGRNLVRITGEPKATRTEPQVVERRQPDPGGLSESEAENIRRTYFQGDIPVCPRDGAVLRVQEVDHLGSTGVPLLIRCPYCGLRGTIDSSA